MYGQALLVTERLDREIYRLGFLMNAIDAERDVIRAHDERIMKMVHQNQNSCKEIAVRTLGSPSFGSGASSS